MQKYLKYGVVFLLFISLIIIRAYAPVLFYDPLMEYFKNDYLYKGIPSLNKSLYFRDLFFRYTLNSIFSISILYIIFGKKFLKFSFLFYTIAFLVLSSVLFFILKEGETNYQLIFYIRRFLVHPIFLLLLLPAFYKKNEIDKEEV